ncbi:MAG: hypothetical protein PHP87_09740 [Syntrophomonas sp.]|uniref:hypothetical protein n=1 Tax=Syntrophomonas sp. TaxID=2053627 RepID=UPI0026248F4D|nr:hypothetical protein [Syntrophomonas sp.]MDD4627342.1 hypothetical protein [Syntrophomonas sp.]
MAEIPGIKPFLLFAGAAFIILRHVILVLINKPLLFFRRVGRVNRYVLLLVFGK